MKIHPAFLHSHFSHPGKTGGFPLCRRSMLILACASLSASAGLPIVKEGPLFGYHAGFTNRKYQLGLTPQGTIRLSPMGDKGLPISHNLAVMITIAIEETKTDGTVIVRMLQESSLESAQPATGKLEKTVIRGKTTGDASFELFLEQAAGVVSIGGRLLDSGTLKTPLRFTIRASIPNTTPYDKKGGSTFRKKADTDHIQLKWTDGQRKKVNCAESVDASSQEINGPGIASLEFETNIYKGQKLLFNTTENAAITLSNSGTASLYKGFTLHWIPDPAKEKDATARLKVLVK